MAEGGPAVSNENTNENSGALFVNDRKEKDSQPDHTGSAIVNGVDYWVSAWIKKSKKGNEFFSLSFRPKDDNK